MAIAACAAGLMLLASCTNADKKAEPHWQPPTANRRTTTAGTALGAASSAGQRTITVLGAGDELLHPQVWAQSKADAKARGETGYDFDPIFASVKGGAARASAR